MSRVAIGAWPVSASYPAAQTPTQSQRAAITTVASGNASPGTPARVRYPSLGLPVALGTRNPRQPATSASTLQGQVFPTPSQQFFRAAEEPSALVKDGVASWSGWSSRRTIGHAPVSRGCLSNEAFSVAPLPGSVCMPLVPATAAREASPLASAPCASATSVATPCRGRRHPGSQAVVRTSSSPRARAEPRTLSPPSACMQSLERAEATHCVSIGAQFPSHGAGAQCDQQQAEEDTVREPRISDGQMTVVTCEGDLEIVDCGTGGSTGGYTSQAHNLSELWRHVRVEEEERKEAIRDLWQAIEAGKGGDASASTRSSQGTAFASKERTVPLLSDQSHMHVVLESIVESKAVELFDRRIQAMETGGILAETTKMLTRQVCELASVVTGHIDRIRNLEKTFHISSLEKPHTEFGGDPDVGVQNATSYSTELDVDNCTALDELKCYCDSQCSLVIENSGVLTTSRSASKDESLGLLSGGNPTDEERPSRPRRSSGAATSVGSMPTLTEEDRHSPRSVGSNGSGGGSGVKDDCTINPPPPTAAVQAAHQAIKLQRAQLLYLRQQGAALSQLGRRLEQLEHDCFYVRQLLQAPSEKSRSLQRSWEELRETLVSRHHIGGVDWPGTACVKPAPADKTLPVVPSSENNASARGLGGNSCGSGCGSPAATGDVAAAVAAVAGAGAKP